MRNRINRRDFVIQAAAVASGAVIGCRSADDPGPISEIASLDHIIVVTMENRSFDHLLGWLPGADGRQNLSYPDRDGVLQAPHHLTITESCAFADPNHSFEGGRQEYNNGALDGWLRADGNDLYTISYYLGADLPFLGKAATEWLVLDRYFCPIMGPTYPNRIISLAAQTDRLSNTPDASTLPTIWDRLIPAGLTGKNYGYTPRTSTALFGLRYASLIRPVSEFYSDAAAGTLPNVSFVDPDLQSDLHNSYHPPADIRNAESFLAGIYKAVTTSPQWKSSLLVITFDEWGGFFDHVVPPVAPIPPGELTIGNTDGLRGFRIPTVLVSPFVKRKSISSRVYDHASVLRLIESRWNLQPLTNRDAEANNLMDEIDLSIPVTAAPVIDYSAGPFEVSC
jgi:phospholipase C